MELRCNACGTEFEVATNIIKCPNCGENRDVVSLQIYRLRQRMKKSEG